MPPQLTPDGFVPDAPRGGGKGGPPPGFVPSGGGKGGLRPGSVRQVAPPTSSGGITRNDVLKELLAGAGMVTGGMVAGPFAAMAPEAVATLAEAFPLLTRVAGAGVGAGTGRAVGHIPEAAVSATTGTPNDSSFAGEFGTGVKEGVVGELLPMVGGTVLRQGGRLASAVGRIPTSVGSLVRKTLGIPSTTTVVGDAVQAMGSRIPNRTTSEWAESGLAALKQRLFPEPVPTHADQMAAAAEKFAGAKRADAAQQAAREAASGLPPDLGERVPVTTHRTAAQPDVDELRGATGQMANERQAFDAEVTRILARPREEGGLVGQGLRPAGPPAPPEPSILDSLRQRSGTSVRPGDAPPPPAAMPPLTVPEPPAGPPTPRAGRTGTGFTMAAPPPLDIPEPMPSHTVVRSSPVVPMASHPVAASAAAPPPATTGDALVQNLEARTTGRAAPPARPTAAPWLDLGRARIAELEAGGVADTDPALQRLRQTVADVEAEAAAAGPPAAAAPRRGPTRGAGGRYGPKLKPTE